MAAKPKKEVNPVSELNELLFGHDGVITFAQKVLVQDWKQEQIKRIKEILKNG